MKYRIKQNIYGNWNGYKGNKKVKEFSNTISGCGAESEANEWLVEMRKKENFK